MQWLELACEHKDGCSRQNCHQCAYFRGFVLRSGNDYIDVKRNNDFENYFAGGLV